MAEPLAPGPPDDGVARLQRWEDAGGVWQILHRADGELQIALLRCDGGEEADRFTSGDPALLRFVGDRANSLD